MTVIAKVSQYIRCDQCNAKYIEEEARPGPLIRIWCCLGGSTDMRRRWLDFCSEGCATAWLVKTHKAESEAT